MDLVSNIFWYVDYYILYILYSLVEVRLKKLFLILLIVKIYKWNFFKVLVIDGFCK